MGKLLDEYQKLKAKDRSKIYMFKAGVFYYFLDDDAIYISNKYNLKVTDFGDSVKCGFPIKALEKYLFLFSNENIELISENEDLKDKVINRIKSINIDEINPREAYIFLSEIKELIK